MLFGASGVFTEIQSSINYIWGVKAKPKKGILEALNTGLNYLKNRINFKYIARLDAGDICHPERFTKQVKCLTEQTSVFLLGTWCQFQNVKNLKTYNYIAETKYEDILKEMHYKCSFIHPTVMFKREVLDSIGVYPYNFPYTEDYAYFWAILKKHTGAVLPEFLVTISVSNKNISSKNYKKQLRSRIKIVKHFGTSIFDKTMGLFLLHLKYLLPSFVTFFFKFR